MHSSLGHSGSAAVLLIMDGACPDDDDDGDDCYYYYYYINKPLFLRLPPLPQRASITRLRATR